PPPSARAARGRTGAVPAGRVGVAAAGAPAGTGRPATSRRQRAQLAVRVVNEPATVGLSGGPGPLRLGRRSFAPPERVLIALVTRTPDSFFDRGATWDEDAAMRRVHAVIAEGADIVDIGGVPAAPGAEVDAAEEINRTADFTAAVRAAYPDVVISVDTWRH